MGVEVLIVSGGGFQGLTLLKELNEVPEATVHVFDCFDDNVGRYFAHYYTNCPLLNDPAFPSFLESYISRNNIGVVIPATAHELPLLSSMKASLTQLGSHVAVSDASLLEVLSDKRRTQHFLLKNKLPVLPSLKPGDANISFPIIGKPATGWGGRGIQVVTNATEWQNKPGLDDYLWQPYLQQFTEISIDFAIDFDGVASRAIFRERIRTTGGYAVIMKELVVSPKLEFVFDKLARVLSAAGACGYFNVQVLETSGEYYISDINPRVGTSAVAGKHTGNNLSYFLLSSFTQLLPQRGRATPPGLKVVRYLEEAYIHFTDLNGVKGIVFDLDETLIPQKRWIHEKIKLMADHFANAIGDRETFLRTSLQLVDEGKAPVLIDELCRLLGLTALREDLIRTYKQIAPDAVSVYPDVLPVLSKLRKNFRLFLLSDNPASTQQQKIERLPFRNLFEHIILTDLYKVEKPDAKAFRLIEEKSGLPASALAMVGDHLVKDIHGALSTGFSFGFHVQRVGSFYNFDVQPLVTAYKIPESKFVTVASLRELLWYL